ncbi:MAG: hypothetical protein IJ623_07880 [Bacteroidales bacterium]|nr:hypothetical protein [Bacteroidales bacterium]
MLLVRLSPPDYLQPISGGTLKEQTWIAFAGSYVGAIIGAAGAILIMFRTISEGQKEKVENRKYADYLYVRDSIEEALQSIDESGMVTVITEMFALLDANYRIPNLTQFERDLSHERITYRKLLRALTQTIIPNQDQAIDALKSRFNELFSLENAFKEFVNKIVVDNNIQEDFYKLQLHIASLTDKLYKNLVEDVQSHHYQHDENCEPIKYSFAKHFDKLLYLTPPNSLSFGEEDAKTGFGLIYPQVMNEYSRIYAELSSSVSAASNDLLLSLKQELVM